MPRILVTRFPTPNVSAAQLGFGQTGYGSLLHGAGFNPVVVDYVDALEALKHGGQFDLALIELDDSAGVHDIGQYAKYLRIFHNRAKNEDNDCDIAPILSHDGLISKDVREAAREFSEYIFLKPLASQQQFTASLGTLCRAKAGNGKPYLRVPNAPDCLEDFIASRLKVPRPLKANKAYDTGSAVLTKESYIGITTRDESLNFFPKNRLPDTTIDVLAYKLGTEFQQKSARNKQLNIPIELHVR